MDSWGLSYRIDLCSPISRAFPFSAATPALTAPCAEGNMPLPPCTGRAFSRASSSVQWWSEGSQLHCLIPVLKGILLVWFCF